MNRLSIRHFVLIRFFLGGRGGEGIFEISRDLFYFFSGERRLIEGHGIYKRRGAIIFQLFRSPINGTSVVAGRDSLVDLDSVSTIMWPSLASIFPSFFFMTTINDAKRIEDHRIFRRDRDNQFCLYFQK